MVKYQYKSERAKSDAEYITENELGRYMIGQVLWKALYHMKREKYPDTEMIKNIERFIQSDLYRELIEKHRKRWLEDIRW